MSLLDVPLEDPEVGEDGGLDDVEGGGAAVVFGGTAEVEGLSIDEGVNEDVAEVVTGVDEENTEDEVENVLDESVLDVVVIMDVDVVNEKSVVVDKLEEDSEDELELEFTPYVYDDDAEGELCVDGGAEDPGESED